jgi:hypothetical protein
MIFWARLYAEMDREQLVEGANLMLKVAKEVLAKQTARQVDQLLIKMYKMMKILITMFKAKDCGPVDAKDLCPVDLLVSV